MKRLLTVACLILVPAAPTTADGNPFKHQAKHQEKLWKEQSKQQRKWLKEQRKSAKEMRKHQEKLWKEQAKQERKWLKAQRKHAKQVRKHQEIPHEHWMMLPSDPVLRWSPFDDIAPQFDDAWHGDPYHPVPRPAPQPQPDQPPPPPLPPPPSPYEEVFPYEYGPADRSPPWGGASAPNFNIPHSWGTSQP